MEENEEITTRTGISMTRELMQMLYELDPNKTDDMKPPEMMSDEEIEELIYLAREEAKQPNLSEEEEAELIRNSPHKAALDQCVQNIAEGLKKLNLKGEFVKDIFCVHFRGGDLQAHEGEFLLTVQHGVVGVVISLVLQKHYNWMQMDKFKDKLVMEEIEGIHCVWDFDDGAPEARMVLTNAYEEEKINNASRYTNKFVAVYTSKLAKVAADMENTLES